MQLPRPVLPSQLTYNDLNGAEATEILVDWFRQLLKSNPLMQPHLTLPMAKFTLDISVGIDMYVGGSVPVESPPEHLDIAGTVALDNKVAGSAASGAGRGRDIPTPGCRMEHRAEHYSTVVNAAPIPGGRPPDEVREMHGLAVPRPAYGPRDTGSHLFLADVPEIQPAAPGMSEAPDPAGGRRGEVAPGYTFSEQVVRPGMPSGSVLDQHIPVDKGEIHIDLTGEGIRHESGMIVKERAHVSSVKEAGDERGKPYSSVNGVYDPGPAGLTSAGRRGGGGLGTDGRPRISFGNSHALPDLRLRL